jgi:hypothetical protein
VLADAARLGFSRPGAVTDSTDNDRAQRAYIALKLFQIERNTRRIADAVEAAANKKNKK